MARKRINLSTSEDQYASIIKAAKKSNMNVSAYCTSLILNSIEASSNQAVTPSSNICPSHKRRYITLSSDEAFILRDKASSLGLSDAEYIRKIIHTEVFKIIEIKSSDIEAYISELHPLIESVNSFVNLIKKAGNNDIYRQDIEKITQQLSDIKDLMIKQLSSSYSNRKKVYKEMIKQCKGGEDHGNS